MVRNSFKFLTIALAAAIIVAPISAIDWNSGSTRWGLAGLGFAVVTIVGVMVYKYLFKKKPQEQVTLVEKQSLYGALINKDNVEFEPKIQQILNKIRNEDLKRWIFNYQEIKKTLKKLEQNNTIENYEAKMVEMQGSQDASIKLIEELLFGSSIG